MPKSKKQRKFNKILDDLAKASAELSVEHMKAIDRGDGDQADLYANAQSLVNVAIELIDPGCNPRFVVKIQEAKHG